MKKLLIVGLMLIASGSVNSSEKEYTLKNCDSKSNPNDDCDKCEVTGKVSFKMSKSLASVMLTVVRNDGGGSGALTIDNCKIFDEETFECETVNDIDEFWDGSSDIWRLYNGKWEHISNIGKSTINSSSHSYSCGTEIKSIYNLFK